jgi:DHA1 family tetracycline resistance protein-like MFS transporter
MGDVAATARKRALLAIFLIVFVDVLGLTIVLPLLPLYAESFGASAFTASLLVPAYAVCQMVAGPLLGGWSDRIGRRPVLIFSQLGTFSGFLIIANAPSLSFVFLGRILDGFTAGNLSVAQAYIADNTPPHERAKSFAIIGIAFGLGFMLGPALAAYLSHFGLSVPFYAAACLSALSIFCTATLLPRKLSLAKHEPVGDATSAQRASAPVAEPLAHGPQADAPAPRRPSVFEPRLFGEYFRRPGLGALLLEFFLYLFVFSMFMSGFALFAERHYVFQGEPFHAKEIGLVYMLAGAVGLVVQGGMLGRLVKRFGEARLVTVGLLSLASGFVLLPQVQPVLMLVVAVVLVASGNALLRPSLTALISRSVAQHEQGAVLGITQSLSSFASIVAAPLSGWLIEHQLLSTWSLVAGLTCLVALAVGRRGSARTLLLSA